MSYLTALTSIIGDTIAPSATKVDQGNFPRAAISALGKAGLLGLLSSKEVGGLGLGLSEAATVIEKISEVCPSTAMVVTMHYSATAVIEKFGSENLRKEIAQGHHLSTLAFSEAGSRSHFWAPVGTAKKVQNNFVINSNKSMVTSAFEADSYVWSTKPVATEGASTLWLVEKANAGLAQSKTFDGLGLRGNASAPMLAVDLQVSEASMLGADAGGFDTMIEVVLPVFCTLIASTSLGMMEATLAATIQHVSHQKLEHLNSALSSLPTVRAYVARARITTDSVRTLRDDTLVALSSNRADAMLRVMEVKAAAAESAIEVTDTAMRVCGGAAFRKDATIEKFFRDARASSIMAPTSDVLYDFIGKAICGLPVFA